MARQAPAYRLGWTAISRISTGLAQQAGGIVLPMLFLGPDRMQEVDGKELYGMDTLGEGMAEGKRYKNQQLAGSAYWVPEMFTSSYYASI